MKHPDSYPHNSTLSQELTADLKYIRRFWRRYLLIELPICVLCSSAIVTLFLHFIRN